MTFIQNRQSRNQSGAHISPMPMPAKCHNALASTLYSTRKKR